jgi:hypothetical protein
MYLSRVLLCVVVVGATLGTAGADDVVEAREHYKRGTKLYDLQ